MNKQNLYLRVPPELREALKMSAARMGISTNALIIQILWRYVEKGGAAA